MILPSFLEYSPESLQVKLDKVLNQETNFRLSTNQSKTEYLEFHLDFVMENFAKDRSVLKGLDLETTLTQIENTFPKKNLDLSIHLMGDIQDLFEARKYLEEYSFNQGYNYTVFVPEKFTKEFKKLEKNNVKIGIWYDLGEWSQEKIEANPGIKDYLLMTVIAGKSGQKLNDDTKEKVLDLTSKFLDKYFILDGGWSLDDEAANRDKSNLRFVSYSSFWKSF
jgi:pentose-5-phosphate-3-epimerase